MKLATRILAISIVFLGLGSCSSSSTNSGSSPTYSTYTATLLGSSETPPNTSAASGTATLILNNSTKIFTLTVTYNGLTPSSGHIHKGAVGVAGDVVFPLVITASPIYYTSLALSADKVADLQAGLYYVNLHTLPNFPNGEIRGQFVFQGTTGGGGGGGY